MDIRRLEHVVALAEEGHFGRASERVHLSQPAFSRSIQAAEAELGLKLFDRGTLEATCTPAGRFVVERARGVLQQQASLRREVAMYRERAVGDLAFGSGPFPAATLVPALLVDLRKHYPGVSAKLHVNNAHYLRPMLEREDIEFFVANTREVPQGGAFEVRGIGRIPGGFYVRRGHPLLKLPELHLADVLPYGIGTGRLPREVAEQVVERMGLPPGSRVPVAVECDDVHVLKRVAMGTDTVIIGTDDLLAGEIAGGTMIPLVLKDFSPAYSYSLLGIVSRAGRTPSPVAQFAMDRLEKLAQSRPSR